MGGIQTEENHKLQFFGCVALALLQKRMGQILFFGGEGDSSSSGFFVLCLLPSDNCWALVIEIKIPVYDNPGALGRGKGGLSQTEKLQVAHSAVMFSKSIKLMKIP